MGAHLQLRTRATGLRAGGLGRQEGQRGQGPGRADQAREGEDRVVVQAAFVRLVTHCCSMGGDASAREP